MKVGEKQCNAHEISDSWLSPKWVKSNERRRERDQRQKLRLQTPPGNLRKQAAWTTMIVVSQSNLVQ